jgi:DNA-binding NarL/FixJ family response regulator
MQPIIKIIIVDDHKIFRTGLEMILNGISDVKVVASAQDGRQLLNVLKKQEADIIFMDIKMPDISGIELTKIIKEKHPDILILALSMFGEIEYFNQMMDAGADGFLLKNTQEEELEQAIKSVMEGHSYLSQEFISTLNRQELHRPHKTQINLSKREHEVLELICKGFSNQEIAKELSISTHTVDGHRRNLIVKTGVKNAPSLVMFAIQNGLITP